VIAFNACQAELTIEQEISVRPILKEAKFATGINGLIAAVHQQWDLESLSGRVLILEIAQLDAKTSRRITTLI
jgi:hypothetical protein